MGLHRIPQKDELFNQYINSTADYLQQVDSGTGVPNWQRLLLQPDEATQWEEFRTGWKELYGIVITNRAKGIRDSNATKAKNDQRKAFTKWALSPEANKLNRIKNAPDVTAKDRAIFKMRLREKNPGPRPAITTAPAVGLKAGGGGIVIITCRVESDSDRASMHPHADNIEMRYILTSVDAQPPTGPEECIHTYTSTRAIFRFEGGVGHPGKRLYAFLRWNNGSDKDKSGPWSQIVTIVISD